MTRRIAIVAATPKEVQPLIEYLKINAEQQAFQTYKLHTNTFDIIISGIGILQTTYTLMDYLSHHHPDGWLQIGIGGAFDATLKIGDVYVIESETIVEFGAEDPNGRVIDQFELGWTDPDRIPFQDGKLICPNISEKISIPLASGMTTMLSHGSHAHIEQLRLSYFGQVENMEGAAFFYISLLKKIPFLSIRSISNLVESRNIKNWKFDLAIKNLNDAVITLLNAKQIPGM